MRFWFARHVLRYGRHCVDRDRLGQARLCVRLLRRLRYTGEYELAAKLALEEGDSARAVELLRRPADLYPQAWILNSYLGQAFSDQGAYAAARERFERVYEHAGPEGGALFNLAIVAQREGDHEEALALLDRSVAEGEPIDRPGAREEVRAWSLVRLDRLEEAETLLRAAPETRYTLATLALALAKLGREDEAWNAVRASFRLEPGISDACEATRVLLDREEPASREYRLTLEGLLDPATHPLGKPWGFFTTAWINADDEEEALAIARRVEPDLLDLRVSESAWEATGQDPRRGYVARNRGHTLYRNTSDWKRD